jgi:hypothetical protein
MNCLLINLSKMHLFVHNDSSQSSCTQRLSSLVSDLLGHCGSWDAQESCAASHVVKISLSFIAYQRAMCLFSTITSAEFKFVEWGRGKMAWSTHLLYTYPLFPCARRCIEKLGVFFFLGDGKMKSVLVLLYKECLAQKLNTLMPKLTSRLYLDDVCFYL